jgi:leucyl-tRNA synthetase
MKKYDHKKIEKKWQTYWQKKGIYRSKENSRKSKQYVLDMFPYPSGEGLHVGHPKGYIATDVYSRFSRMRGYEVLHPMGWDAFGLPAENYAIKNKVHPRKAVEKNIKRFKEQLKMIGLDYDWTREINTTDPDFYKWTQWIFLKLYEKGLAYQSNEPINWCPTCQTGLSNEDLEGNTCERCGTIVEKRPMRQWILKITDYADRMLEDLKLLPEWQEHIKESQRNWIGKSEGAEIDFELQFDDAKLNENRGPNGEKAHITVFTTRPDTLYGATFLILSPEHLWVTLAIRNDHAGVLRNQEEVRNYVGKPRKRQKLKDRKIKKRQA